MNLTEAMTPTGNSQSIYEQYTSRPWRLTS